LADVDCGLETASAVRARRRCWTRITGHPFSFSSSAAVADGRVEMSIAPEDLQHEEPHTTSKRKPTQNGEADLFSTWR
jgi:hypothetical protein